MNVDPHNALVVGVDYGTLSGRAVVVRVARRRRARQRRPRLPRTPSWSATPAPAPARALPPGLGAAGARPTTSTCCAHAVPGAAARPPASTRADVDRHRHRLHRLHHAADPRRRHAAVRAARASRDRPHAYVKLWKHHAAQGQADRINALAARARRAVDRRATAALISWSGSSPRACSCSRRTPRSTTRTEHWVEAADWIVWQLCGTLRPQRLHRRLQGHLPGRRLPVARTSSPRSTPTSPTSSTTSSTHADRPARRRAPAG